MHTIPRSTIPINGVGFPDTQTGSNIFSSQSRGVLTCISRKIMMWVADTFWSVTSKIIFFEAREVRRRTKSLGLFTGDFFFKIFKAMTFRQLGQVNYYRYIVFKSFKTLAERSRLPQKKSTVVCQNLIEDTGEHLLKGHVTFCLYVTGKSQPMCFTMSLET